MNFRVIMLCVTVLFIPYQLRLPDSFGVPGFNTANVIFLLTLAVNYKTIATTPSEKAPMRGLMFAMIAALFWGFVVGQLVDSSTTLADLTRFKDIAFWMMFYFLFFHAVRDQQTIEKLFVVMMFVTLIASLQSIRQAIDYGLFEYVEEQRSSGPFGIDYRGANAASIYYVMFFPLALSVAMQAKSRPTMRLFAYGCMVANVLAVFVTYSRQSYFILAGLLVLFTLQRRPLLIPLVVVALLSFESWAPQGVVDRIQMTRNADSSGEGKLDESTESRLTIWGGALQLIEERPLGQGLNHFGREIGRMVEGYRNMDAHNAYVLFTTECGVLGGLVMIMLVVRLVFYGRSVERVDDREDTKVIGTAYFLSAVAVLIGNFYGSRFFNGEVMGNFWIFTALAARYRVLAQERPARESLAQEALATPGPAHQKIGQRE